MANPPETVSLQHTENIGQKSCMYYDSAMKSIVLPVADKTGSIKNDHPIITAPFMINSARKAGVVVTGLRIVQ